MREPATLTEALADRFAGAAGEPAVVELLDADPAAGARTLTYGELDRRARALAGWLTARQVAGRPVMVALETGADLAVAVVGCLYAGAVAVPVPPPSASPAAAERTTAIARETGVPIVLTESRYAADVSRRLSDAGRGTVLCLAVDRPLPDGAAQQPWQPPRLRPSDVALVQYTSGSTAAPRGVQVTHANLLATMREIQQALGTHRGSRIGGWLPCYHDLGLIGQLLHPLWLGATAVLMPPRLFLARPVRWLRAIDQYGVTVAAAPDSAYARCTAEITDEEIAGLDLSRWEAAVNAAEPVAAATVEAFTARFAAAGLRPGAMVAGYGLAEATLLVSTAGTGPVRVAAGLPEGAPAGRRVVSCGPPRGGEVRIVDPTDRTELPDGAEGEVWVRGPSVAAGYWQRPLETAEVFGAVTAAGARGFLRTGDLGVLREGELYLTGRLKDTVVVAGQSVHPQEMERRLIDCGERLASAVVFGADQPDRLVVVQEVRHPGRDQAALAALAARVRGCLAEEFGASAVGVVLVRPGSVRRTTSGKVRRSTMRQLFLRGDLRPVYAELDDSLLAPDRPDKVVIT
ncbi:fatty acyl-AMP ligase [Streptomyces sp. TLI_171]|uniref:fatty acyl-AMP ligase n=1 Tax=Streptomyces sp. TLI_171 TaxID=1938859 RepID=UPI000C6B9E9F|nr:fatty acyl-AMP ligase [Streptomyces sp. TLI_171]RKE21258.1 acyl-CoA synthetase (AMP-forming)/AMP-acid ligase II [Streptomyces sp. TLI_171]